MQVIILKILYKQVSYYLVQITAWVWYPISEKAFEILLNVKEPWQITNTEFDLTSEKLNIWLDFKRGPKFPCPKCETKMLSLWY